MQSHGAPSMRFDFRQAFTASTPALHEAEAQTRSAGASLPGVRKCSFQHFMQTLPPGTSGELHQELASLDPHTTHVVPAAVKISVRCVERET